MQTHETTTNIGLAVLVILVALILFSSLKGYLPELVESTVTSERKVTL
jgi:hypothetical protein